MYYLKLAQELFNIRRRMVKASDCSNVTNPDSGESFVLGYLSNSNKAVNPKEIGDAMKVSSARIAKILNQLETKEMVSREPSVEDGRSTNIVLLPTGKEQHKKNVEQFYERAEYFLTALGPEDAAEYVRLQNRIADIYTSYIDDGKKASN